MKYNLWHSNTEIRALHVELTNRCNSACPMCLRTFNDDIKSNINDISIDTFKKWFSPDFIKSLTNVKFVGCFGDPAVATDCLKIHEYVYECNPNISFLMSTNSGVRTTPFWSKLAKLYKNDSRMLFCIDGLEDTNHIYRRGVKWQKVIDNITAFNNAGGQSTWLFIPFFHNEHQVEEAKVLSEKLGCTKFAVRVSARNRGVKAAVKFEDGTSIYPPASSEFDIQTYAEEWKKPKCQNKMRQELYINVWGRILPCCYSDAHATTNKMNIPTISLYDMPLTEALNHPFLKGLGDEPWKHKELTSLCHTKCTGKNCPTYIDLDNNTTINQNVMSFLS